MRALISTHSVVVVHDRAPLPAMATTKYLRRLAVTHGLRIRGRLSIVPVIEDTAHVSTCVPRPGM